MTPPSKRSTERQRRDVRLTMLYMARAAKLSMTRPVEAYDFASNRAAYVRAGTVDATRSDDFDDDWLARLHRLIGAESPCAEDGSCEEAESFSRAWADLERRAATTAVAQIGGYDGDRTLGRAAWCVLRHLRPRQVLETGVARGATSRLILEALIANGDGGRLWSIDLPPMEEPWQSQVGVLVPDELRGSWTYRRGSSRRWLAPLVRQLGTVGVFLHDSLHTAENIAFELRTVWPHLAAPGAAVVDDVGDVSFLRELATDLPGAELIVARPVGKEGAVGILVKLDDGRRGRQADA